MVVKHFEPQHPRFATIKSASGNNPVMPSLFVDLTGKRLLVEAEAEIKASTAVTVEFEDALFLGEVVTCRQENGGFELEIKVEQVLSGLQSLMALRSRLLSDAPVNYSIAVTPFVEAFAGR